MAGAAGLGGELAVAVAVAVGGGDGEIIGSAGGRERRRLTAHAAIQCHRGGGTHDRGGGCSTGWLGGGDSGGGREYWRGTIAGSFLFFFGASLWDPNKALTFRSLAFFKMQSLSLLPLF